ncbi:hypothetical protein OG458_41610 (plasmid) [Streptomyces sp. NBC_01281]|uniref:hypothetical protein n=1 Tax=Streptomyces sp. NBC_01281 TaxID=2903811 RepID=UPI002E1244C9|nr:hypothetical protein OG458_41610 [Streptomyces sp. NBC_01281]
MTNQTPEPEPEPTPEPQPAPDATPEPIASRAPEQRHSGLNALGTFFAGLAALMTVLTAAATSYVAVATYQNEQEQDAQKEKAADFDFAQRVELLANAGDPYHVTLDNPNNFPVSSVVVTIAEMGKVTPKGTGVETSGKVVPNFVQAGLLPSCSRLTLSLDKKGLALGKHKVARWNIGAMFHDRKGTTWQALSGATFTPMNNSQTNLVTNPVSISLDLLYKVWIVPPAKAVKITKSLRCK